MARMASEMLRWIPMLALLFASFSRLAAAASPEEEQALKAANESFRLTYYERAEKDFGDFVQKFTNSTHLAEAIFFQAESRRRQSNFAGTISLLTTNLANAGPWTDKYLYCLGEAHKGLKAFDKAGEAFGRLTREFPGSSIRLEASFQEAWMRSQLGAWDKVIHLLQDTNGVFQALARTNMGSPLVFQGYMLLGEAQLAQKDYAGAKLALEPFQKSLMSSTNAWQWQHLLCRIQLAAGSLDEALQSATNLVARASETGQVPLRAESFAFEANVLERLGRLDRALEAYTNNLVEGVPAFRQREALFKVAELSVVQNRSPEATQILDRFLTQFPKTSSADVAWLGLGELLLRQYYDSSGAKDRPQGIAGLNGNTNLLVRAKSALLNVVTNFAQSPVLGKCHLDLGWCYWLDNNPAESEKHFSAALDQLPRSADRAMAHFKLGDLQFGRGNSAGAVTNYDAVFEETGSDPSVETNLLELALYQTVRAALASTNLPAATNAITKLIAWYPESYHTDGSVLLTGQSISRNDPKQAGALYIEFLNWFPNAVLRPYLELAIARTYELGNAWTNAIQQYQGWLTRFTNHEARPRAEYSLGQALARNGDQTNAFGAFTNFVIVFPNDDLTPLAQWWVADFYFNNGAYAAAETNYQAIAARWPKSDLSFSARLMAGRSAMGRLSWDNAANFYFWPLCTNPCPPEIKAQAWSALGEATMSQDSTNKIENYRLAIGMFKNAAAEATNTLSIAAWGQIASCYLQWAQIPGQLTNAVDYFQKIIDEPKADASTRSIAKVGIAIVLLKQAADLPAPEQLALRTKALNHYLDVFDGRILRPGEVPDPFWTKKAGMDAADVASSLENWSLTAQIYERLIELLPALRPNLQYKLRSAQEKAKVAQANQQ